MAGLLRRVLGETDIRKLRLSSVEPMDWTNDLLDLTASSDRIAEHIHIPMQSGSDGVLKAMRRRYRARHYTDRVERVRRLMPDAAIGADVMIGFPGETAEDFEATRQLVADLPFTYLHVFTYSARPDTEAHMMPGHISPPVKKERNRILRELAAEKNLAFRRSLVGQRFEAVTLDHSGAVGDSALTDNYVTVQLAGTRRHGARLIEVEIESVDGESTYARKSARPSNSLSSRMYQPRVSEGNDQSPALRRGARCSVPCRHSWRHLWCSGRRGAGAMVPQSGGRRRWDRG